PSTVSRTCRCRSSHRPLTISRGSTTERGAAARAAMAWTAPPSRVLEHPDAITLQCLHNRLEKGPAAATARGQADGVLAGEPGAAAVSRRRVGVALREPVDASLRVADGDVGVEHHAAGEPGRAAALADRQAVVRVGRRDDVLEVA